MPPHHPQNIVPLHRGVKSLPWAIDCGHNPGAGQPRSVRPIEPERLARIMGEPVDLYKSLEQPRRGLLDRIAEAMSAPRFILFYLGFYAGCMATVALALIWSKVL